MICFNLNYFFEVFPVFLISFLTSNVGPFLFLCPHSFSYVRDGVSVGRALCWVCKTVRFFFSFFCFPHRKHFQSSLGYSLCVSCMWFCCLRWEGEGLVGRAIFLFCDPYTMPVTGFPLLDSQKIISNLLKFLAIFTKI